MKLTTVTEYLESIADGPLSQPDAKTCQETCIAYLAAIDAFQGVYSDELVYADCVAGESRHDSHRVYLEDGAIDRAKGGAWIHRIKPELASC